MLANGCRWIEGPCEELHCIHMIVKYIITYVIIHHIYISVGQVGACLWIEGR